MRFKVLYLILILLDFGLIYHIHAQVVNSNTSNKQRIIIGHETGIYPTRYIILDEKIIKTDTLFTKQLDVSWIKKIKVVKNGKYKKLYDTPIDELSLLIFIKKKYISLVNEMIETKYKNIMNYGTQPHLPASRGLVLCRTGN